MKDSQQGCGNNGLYNIQSILPLCFLPYNISQADPEANRDSLIINRRLTEWKMFTYWSCEHESGSTFQTPRREADNCFNTRRVLVPVPSTQKCLTSSLAVYIHIKIRGNANSRARTSISVDVGGMPPLTSTRSPDAERK